MRNKMANDKQYRRITPEEIRRNLKKFQKSTSPFWWVPKSTLWWGCALLGIAAASLLEKLLWGTPIPLWLYIIIAIVGVFLCGNTIRRIASTKSPKPDPDEDIIPQMWQGIIMWLSMIFILWFAGTLLAMDIFIWQGIHIKEFFKQLDEQLERK